MPLVRSLGHVVGTTIRGARLLSRGTVRVGRWAGRRMGAVKARGAGGETGMIRLFDLHAASCAGDTLITIGLAGTIFFNAPLGEARSKVALYLLVTMVPFALLAPVVGPLLDHFRHGRRYALAATMLGRAFLAWLISDYIHGFGLYPAAFGVLALSRAYGVARSAAVPRLLPPQLGLSQAGARASVYGTVAGAAAAPIGAAAFYFGPQWPLRVASVIFLIGMVTALRLPPRADSDPPEIAPRPLRALGFRRGERALTGRLVWATLIGSATLRGLYGFLLLFLAFAVKAGHLTTVLLGNDVGPEGALAVIAGALAAGTFLATAVGTRLRIHRPVALQSNGLVIVAGLAVFATIYFSLTMVALVCLVTAIMSGIGKLSVDATIQERIPERMRASAFAHSETILMLAFVAGGALGLIPMDGRIGVGAAAGFGIVAALRAVVATGRLRKERLHGRALADAPPAEPTTASADGADADRPTATRRRWGRHRPGRRSEEAPAPEPASTPEPVAASAPSPRSPGRDDDTLTPPGFHLYRPSSAKPAVATGDDDRPDANDEGPRRGRPDPH
jgi:MFS family permease